MRKTSGVLASAAILALLMTAGIASAATEGGPKGIGDFDNDDGTYLIQSVTSVEECEALCKADRGVCRGQVVYQPDISKPEMQCRLNNGFGTNAAFPNPEPKALDYDKALSDLNTYRASNGLRALTYNKKLNKASEVHARDIASAGILSHTGTDGSGHGDRIQRQGYELLLAAENAAARQMSWEAVFDGWKKSPGHNENLLRDDVSEFGIALVYEPRTKHLTYWVMLVAQPFEE